MRNFGPRCFSVARVSPRTRLACSGTAPRAIAPCSAAKGPPPLKRRNIATFLPQVGPFRELLRGDWAHALGPVEGFRHADANILQSQMVVKSRFSHSSNRLFPGSAKNELSARLVNLVGKFF